MSLYRRGDVWWYKFRFAGQIIRESSKSESKTVAKDAERVRHRELEESWNQIKKRTLPPRLTVLARLGWRRRNRTWRSAPMKSTKSPCVVT